MALTVGGIGELWANQPNPVDYSRVVDNSATRSGDRSDGQGADQASHGPGTNQADPDPSPAPVQPPPAGVRSGSPWRDDRPQQPGPGVRADHRAYLADVQVDQARGPAARSRSARASARSGAARWWTAMSTGLSAGAFGHDLLQPGDRLRRGADLLQQLDPAAGRAGATASRRAPSPATPARSRSVHRGAGSRGCPRRSTRRWRRRASRRRRPRRRPCHPPPRSGRRPAPRKPSAMATIPVSTTRTGTGAAAAARHAASYVPENSADRCSETTGPRQTRRPCDRRWRTPRVSAGTW